MSQDQALLPAAAAGNKSVVQQLLAAGANVHTRTPDGETPLHKAARRHLPVCQLLLEAGADVHQAVPRGYPFVPDSLVGRQTALSLAPLKNHFAIAEQLLQAGADLDDFTITSR